MAAPASDFFQRQKVTHLQWKMAFTEASVHNFIGKICCWWSLLIKDSFTKALIFVIGGTQI